MLSSCVRSGSAYILSVRCQDAKSSYGRITSRFWLEDEIWFSEYEKTPMPVVGQTYIEHYRKAQL
jgi:hypothetical protein